MKNPKTILFEILVSSLLLFSTSIYGQGWHRLFPGFLGGGLVEMPDGGFLTSADDQSASPLTAAMKLDPQGNQQWVVELPDSFMYNNVGTPLLSADGNYILTGRAFTDYAPNGNQYSYLIKIDAAGNKIWERYYFTIQNIFVRATTSSDGGIFLGSIFSFLMKVDPNGNILWQRTGNDYNAWRIVATNDGGAIFITFPGLPDYDAMAVKKVDANGNIIWVKEIDSPDEDITGQAIIKTSDNGFMIAGAYKKDIIVLKFDEQFNEVWRNIHASPLSEGQVSIQETTDGGYVILGERWNPGIFNWQQVYIWKFDNQSNLVWEKGYFTGNALMILSLSDDGYLFSSLANNGLHIIRTDTQGNVFQNRIKGKLAEDLNEDCQHQTSEQGLAGWAVHANGPLTFFGSTDADGNFEIEADTGNYNLVFYPPTLTWQPCLPTQPANLPTSPMVLDIGTLPAKSVPFTTSTISGIVFQDLDGNCEQDPGEPGLPGLIVWSATEGNSGNPQYIDTTDANGYYSFTLPAGTDYYWVILAESNNPYCPSCNNDWLQFLNVDPITHNIGVQCNIPAPQLFTGFVFFDENENCQPDFGEPGLNGWTIEAVKLGTMDSFQILSAQFPNGNFAMLVDTGSYILTIIPPNYLFLPCQFVYTVNVALGGSPTLYIPLMPLAECPKLTVDIGAWGLRPCFTNRYVVQYCNEGTAAAEDAYVQVTFPPSLTVDSSEITGTALPGNVWEFQLGDLPIDSCGSFWIDAFLNCADSVGWTYCAEAHIFPDSICGPSNATWDGSSVELNADCIGDSVILTISNAGWGSMSQPLNFIVVEDNVLIRDSSFQLPAGGSTQVTVFPNGATIILSAQQAAGHPGMSMPIVFVEGCGGDSISLGFVTQYPQDDADCFIAIDCRESVAACDPNTKEAQPRGVTDAHFIENTTELTYQITFQNLGTASAQNVVILDTLSQYLDTSRLQLGVSSHHYEFELLPPNVLKFTFPNIQLPHADLDYEGSIGFVKYRVPQRPGNLPGTEIQNRAGIYFDFNDPVITNTVTHRIPAPQYVQNQQVLLCAGDIWNGQPILADTAISVVTHYAFFDSIQNTVLDVVPTAMVEVDTTVAVGAVVYGVLVNADTSFTQIEMTPTYCIERNVSAHILTAATPGLENLRQFTIAPNPAFGHLTLNGQLTTGAFCEAKLMDAYGRTITQFFENEWIAGIFSRRVDLLGVLPGLYFVSFATDGERGVMKVVVE